MSAPALDSPFALTQSPAQTEEAHECRGTTLRRSAAAGRTERRRADHARPQSCAETARARRQSRARSANSHRVGRGIHRPRAHHTLQPRRWGGYEHDHEVAFDIAIELGKSTCGSSAWCLNYLADHACMLALFPEEAQHDV